MRKKWSKLYNKCISCGTRKNVHRAEGRCSICYNREIYIPRKRQERKDEDLRIRKAHTKRMVEDCGLHPMYDF